MAGFDLQQAYGQAGGGQSDPDADSQQDQSGGLTIPPDVFQQIGQALQQKDCATVCQLVASVIAQQGQASQ